MVATKGLCFVEMYLQVNWILAYIPTDDPDDFVLYCYSDEEAEDVHPSEVETWYCEFREMLGGGRRGSVWALSLWFALGKGGC